MRSYILKLSPALLVSVLPVQGADIRYEELPALIGESNPSLRATQLSLEAHQAREGSLGRSYLPEVSVGAAAERYKLGVGTPFRDSFGYHALAKVNLFNGGRDSAESRIRETQSRVFGAEQTLSRVGELSSAQIAFWELMALAEQKRIVTEALALNDANGSAAERRIGAGLATSSDRLEFQLKRVALTQDLAQIESRRLIETSRLRVKLGRERGEPLNVVGELTHSHDWERAIVADKPAVSPKLARAQMQVELADAIRSKASRFWLPSLDLYGGHTQELSRKESGTPPERRETFFGLELKFDFGNVAESYAQTRATRLESEASRALAGLEEATAQEESSALVERLRLLHSLLHEADENVLRGENYLKLTRSEYGRGVKNSIDMLNASERFVGYKLRRVELLKEFQQALVELQAITGL